MLLIDDAETQTNSPSLKYYLQVMSISLWSPDDTHLYWAIKKSVNIQSIERLKEDSDTGLRDCKFIQDPLFLKALWGPWRSCGPLG